MIKYDYSFLRLYFADGHCEFKDEDIKHYIVKQNTGYKNPVYMYKQWLYPTGDYHYRDCLWIQLNCFEEYLLVMKSLISDEQMRLRIKKLYLNHIEKKFIQNHF